MQDTRSEVGSFHSGPAKPPKSRNRILHNATASSPDPRLLRRRLPARMPVKFQTHARSCKFNQRDHQMSRIFDLPPPANDHKLKPPSRQAPAGLPCEPRSSEGIAEPCAGKASARVLQAKLRRFAFRFCLVGTVKPSAATSEERLIDPAKEPSVVPRNSGPSGRYCSEYTSPAVLNFASGKFQA